MLIRSALSQPIVVPVAPICGYAISEAGYKAIQKTACLLQAFPHSRVSIIGHASEFGSREGNLGLGERIGNTVQEALLSMGGRPEQTSVTSYGEERPLIDMSGWVGDLDLKYFNLTSNARFEIEFTSPPK